MPCVSTFGRQPHLNKNLYSFRDGCLEELP